MEQRLTFRKAEQDYAWQKQLRDRFESEGLPNGLTFDMLNLKNSIAKRVNREAAKSIILKYEWLGTLPSGCNIFYGLFFGDFCAGVTCIGSCAGANVNAFKEFNLNNYNELAYLARGANVHWSPNGANSKLVSLSAKLLAKETNKRLLIAYSDTDAGEIGTIYQACNWICVGKGSSTTQYISPTGRIYDQKYPSDLKRQFGGTRKYWNDRLIKDGWTLQKSNPKYRYCYVINKNDTELIKLVNSLSVPYPKRR